MNSKFFENFLNVKDYVIGVYPCNEYGPCYDIFIFYKYKLLTHNLNVHLINSVFAYSMNHVYNYLHLKNVYHLAFDEKQHILESFSFKKIKEFYTKEGTLWKPINYYQFYLTRKDIRI